MSKDIELKVDIALLGDDKKLVVFCALHKLDSVSEKLEKFATNELTHYTLQHWNPNQDSEQNMYSNSDMHGSAPTNFPMNGSSAIRHVVKECENSNSFKRMSAVTEGKAPLILTTCRSYQYPVPFHYIEDWLINSL